jgi:hypothetical protein
MATANNENIGPRDRVRRILSLGWVPLVASLLSLILSVTSIVVATRDPAVVLVLPDQIRVAQAASAGYAYAYLQPTFLSTGDNDRVEVIRDMRLEVRAPDGEVVELAWNESGRFDFDRSDGSLSYAYVADAAPILVGPETAQNPIALFQGPDGWQLSPGRYEVRLVADREVATSPLEASFRLELTADQVAQLTEADGAQFLALDIGD